jgi:dihydrofolate synthase/folylpolyglutamate synthase
MKIDEALEKLYSMHKFGIKLGLENIKRLLEHLGNPENKFDSIHIAGSNGKGSTASFIASIAKEAGGKVGLYTSPHFIRFNERVRIDGIPVEDEYIAEFIASLDSYIYKFKPTFFEITTALAFNYFAEMGIDFGVIETGLGGRLDATNVIHPLSSVITTISYEHTNILGESLVEIAREKAGIIKPNTPVFVGIVDEKVEDEIRAISVRNESKIIFLKNRVVESDDSLSVSFGAGNYKIRNIPLKGRHQKFNAALALISAADTLKIDNKDVLNRGLTNVIGNSGLQGRYEYYSESPVIIFDSAHNLEGVEIFLREFRKEKNKYGKASVIFGAMKDKNISSMLKKLGDVFDNIYVTSINYERAAELDELKAIGMGNNINVIPLKEPWRFINDFQRGDSADCLVLLGSIYILGEIKSKL